MADIKKIKLGNTTYNIVDGTHKNIIILEDNSSTTAGTWLAKTDRISAYTDGQLFIYKVAKAGSSTTTLNITGSAGTALGAKTIYRTGSTKLTTQYAVGSYVMLYYSSSLNSGSFLVVNDSDIKTTSGNTDSKIFLIGTTSQSTSGETTYSHDTAYVGTDGCLYSGGTKVSIVGHTHEVTTANAAPHTHNHTVTVNGTTGKNSGTGVTALTGVKVSASSSAAPGGHKHSYDKTTSISLSSSSTTSTGSIKYTEDISGSKPTLGGTKTFVTGVTEGSGSLKSYDASTNGNETISSGRIQYVHSITPGSASGTGSGTAAPNNHTHSYNTYSLSGSNSSHTKKYLNSSTTAADTSSVGISSGGGSLEAYDAATNGTKKVSNGTRIPVITALTKGSYTPAGSVSLTSGTAPSMNFNTNSTSDTPYISAISGGSAVSKTTKYMKFTPGDTPPTGASFSGTQGTTGGASGTTGEATPTFTGSSVTSGAASGNTGAASGSTAAASGNTGGAELSTNSATTLTGASVTNGVLTITSGTHTHSIDSHSHTLGSHTHGLNSHVHSLNSHTHSVSIEGTVGAHTHTISSHTHSFTPAGNVTFTLGDAPSMNFNTGVTTDTPYISAVSGGSAVSATTKYMKFTPGTTPKSSASFTGTATNDLVTGGTTYYVAHGHTSQNLTGTTTFATNGIKAVSLNSASTTSTGAIEYVSSATNSSLSLTTNTNSGTTGTNSGSAVSTISGVSYTAPQATTYHLAHTHTSAKSAGTGTVTISGGEYTANTKYLTAAPGHTSTVSSVNSGTDFNAATAVAANGTASVAPNEHTHSYGSSTALTTSANSGSAVAAVTEVKASTN